MASKPVNFANPNDVAAWIETVIDEDGGLLGAADLSMTAVDSSTVDGTYGAQEQAVLADCRTAIGEIQAFLVTLGAPAAE